MSQDSTPLSETTTILKNAGFVTLGLVALKLVGFLYNVFVVRRLGDDRMGQYATVLAFVGIFQIFAELGVTQHVMREIARDRTKMSVYFWNLVAIRFVLALVNLLVIPFLGARFGYSGDVLLGIGIYTTSFLLSAVGVPLSTVLTAYEKLGYVTLLDVITQGVVILLGTAFLFSGLGFLWLIVGNLISLMVSILLASLFIRRLGISGFRFHIEPLTWPPLIRAGLPFGIISLMLSLAYSIDTVILSKFVSSAEVGWYGVAYNLVFSLMLFMNGFKAAIVPTLSRVYREDIDQVKRWYRWSMRFLWLFSLPVAVGGSILSYQLITWLYTTEFLPSGLAFQILAWDFPFVVLAAFAGNMTTITNEERSAARIYSVNTFLNVVLNLILIPRFGLIGASLVTVLTDVVSALQFVLLFRRKLGEPFLSFRQFSGTVMAAFLMGAVIWPIRQMPLIFVVLAGAAVYLLLALWFRVLDKDDLQRMEVSARQLLIKRASVVKE